MMNRTLFFLLASVLLSNCSRFPSPSRPASAAITLPDGSAGFSIFCDKNTLVKEGLINAGWGLCYRIAGQVCSKHVVEVYKEGKGLYYKEKKGKGYEIVEKREQVMPEDSQFYDPRFMIIKCKKSNKP